MKVPITVITPSMRTMVPARNMSWAMSEVSSSGPTVGRLSTSETMMLPDTTYGKEIGDAAGEGVERGAHRIFHDDAHLGKAFGARGHDVGLAQLVEQVGAHDADELRGAGNGKNEGR